MPTLFIPHETAPGETRVAAVPDTVRRLAKLGLEVQVQSGAGAAAGLPDERYTDAGATIVPDASAQSGADIVARVNNHSLGILEEMFDLALHDDIHNTALVNAQAAAWAGRINLFDMEMEAELQNWRERVARQIGT